MIRYKLFNRIVTAGLLGAMALIMACAKESDSDKENANLLILGAAMLSSSADTRSYDALPLVPSVLASSTDTGSSATGQSVINDAVPAGAATDKMRNIFRPVRASVYIGKEMVRLGGQIITNVETVLKQYPGLATAGTPLQITDSSDTAHPGRIVRLSNSTTFGDGSRKVEIWWTNTGADALRDGKKILELDYRLDAATVSASNIDGVLYFRDLPKERPTEFAYARLEFKKTISGADITRTAYVYVQNYFDFRNNTGANAAFFINEDAAGRVTVEGGYTAKGLLMPFQEQNVASTGWDTGDERVYLFNGAGSTTIGKAVVNVVLPLRGESAAVDAATTPFANGQAWSLGELFTDGLLYYLANHTETYGAAGTQTGLWFLNVISGASPALTTGSTQAELLTALNSINVSTWGTSAAQVIADLKIVAGIKNPVYFQKDLLGISLVGQEDTDGLTGAADYTQLQGLLPADFAWFTMEELFTLDIAAGTSVDLMTGHTGIAAWTGINDAPPSI